MPKAVVSVGAFSIVVFSAETRSNSVLSKLPFSPSTSAA